ncbi:hypothetical protein [Chryseobacterium sp. FH1]|uniref:hypothetical protein n=1 Tax=Chryseobacterium sp. FH1 TaxID=1233951 RepID=UPI0004E4207C|nr:hypothetical protein [Chryseobacterium sp. FH1]KFC24252.1 hypothetical protein IO90_02840 [Chryseobacterium sp. FH1]
MTGRTIGVILVIIICLCFNSCTSFNKYSKFNKVQNCGEDNIFLCITNDGLKIKYQSFGGFDFAKNSKEYKKLKVGKKRKFKNILLYGQSKIINTEYYILIDNKEKKTGFVYKDTIINKIPISVAVNDSSNKINKEFLLKGLLDFDE